LAPTTFDQSLALHQNTFRKSLALQPKKKSLALHSEKFEQSLALHPKWVGKGLGFQPN